MTANERALLEVLRERSFKSGEFTLVSGEKSTYYIDGKMSLVYSASARLIGEILYERTVNLGIDAIGGLEVGAVPMTSVTAMSYDQHGKSIEGFWVRDRTKAHGTKKLIEGGLKPGMKTVVIDDVFTKGGSAMKAVQAVREHGCEVTLVLGIVDRLSGARELFEGEGLKFETVFTIRDFGVKI